MKNIYRVLFSLLALFSVGCDNDEPKTVVTVQSIELAPESLNLTIGQSYALELTITPADAEYSAVEWLSDNPDVASVSESGEVVALSAGQATITCTVDEHQATCGVTVVSPVPDAEPKIGDYYYSDGYWSTELDTTREVIGIVFWCGDPTAHDAALRREHPECTHGLVVGLKHERTAWQSNFSASGMRVSAWVEENVVDYEPPIVSNLAESVGRIVGYNNTKAIEAFNDAVENATWPVEAVEAVVAYRRTCAAPASSSDWYLPSPKELSLLCSGEYDGNIYFPDIELGNANRAIINERMSVLNDFNSLAGITHWSSAEFDEREVDEESIRVGWMVAVNAYFNDGDISVAFKDANSGHLRFVLAF